MLAASGWQQVKEGGCGKIYINDLFPDKVMKEISSHHRGVYEHGINEVRFLASNEAEEIVRMHESKVEKERIRMVLSRGEMDLMEYRMNRMKDPSLSHVLTIMKQITKGISAVHRKGYIYGDMKPQNVVVFPDESVRLIDFGTIHQLEEVLAGNRSKVPKGSVRYMAPEVVLYFEGKVNRYDHRCDCYSLGMLLWFLVSGQRPYPALNIFDIKDKVLGKGLPPVYGSDVIGKPLQTLFQCSLAANPEDRCTVEQWYELLRSY